MADFSSMLAGVSERTAEMASANGNLTRAAGKTTVVRYAKTRIAVVQGPDAGLML